MNRVFLLGAGALALLIVATTPARAQDPVVDQARAAGAVGEQADGYLGLREGGSADLRARVDQINIKRRAAYTDLAAKRGVTPTDVGAATACQIFSSGGVAPGEWYRNSAGAWRQREGSAPVEQPAYCG